MKKLISYIIITLTFIPFLISDTNAEKNESYFVVTAYYSPLPNQEHYSYSVYTKRERTYEEEKRLQWQWIAWASWKAVFSWMLAAPKNYKFWTKISLEWLGVWEVADRWGAIVNKWVRWYGYDRIDVWMWYGDEWLKRATYWGKRTIKWSFVAKEIKVNLDYKIIPAPDWVIKSIANNFKRKIISKIDIFSKKITSNAEIKQLQDTLTEMNIYSWEIDGKIKSTIDSVYAFQLSKKIVIWTYSPWAWFYGPITRAALKKEYNLFLVEKENKRLELARIEELKEKEKLRIKNLSLKFNEFAELSSNKAWDKLKLIWSPKFWEISSSVRELQNTLKLFGHFDYKDTAIYGNITKNSIISYQLDKNIIKDKNDYWAWIVWPKTKKAIKIDLKNKFLNEIVELEEFDLNELVLIDWKEI